MFAPPRISNALILAVFCIALPVLRAAGGNYSFTNPAYITMDESSNNPLTAASPYPSSITVSGLTGQLITGVTVTINGFSHDFPSDANLLLVGPGGQMAILMSDVGGVLIQHPVTDLTITFDQNCPYPLPINDPLYSLTYRPGAYLLPLPFSFPAPAPAGNANAPADLSVFNNTDPDGTWSLYVVDDSEGDSGSISGGWSMKINASAPLAARPAGTNIVFSWPAVSNETFTLQVSPNLFDTKGWSNAPGSATLSGGKYLQTNANGNVVNSIKYYRLLGN